MFRFTIRDVLWLMVVVGLGVGWLDRSRLESRLANAESMHDDYTKMLDRLHPNWRTISESDGTRSIPVASEAIRNR